MCRPDAAKAKPLKRLSSSFLSVDAFDSKPSVGTMGLYGAGVLAFLYSVEHLLRYVFVEYQVSEPFSDLSC
jgi:hypothetical protein